MKLFSSLILSLCSVLVLSQTILYQPESTSRTVQDPQAVVMAQGFHAKSDASNSFLAKIGPATENPGGGPTDSQAGANNPSGTSAPDKQSFHDTKGKIEVNGGGQLQFTLPIALPPGVKTVAPQINLMYTSGSGNGIAGYGWNLTGITSISRTGKNIEKDGVAQNIQIDYSDYYIFNGQRLILKSGEYGKDNAEYTTEEYSNIKIKSIGAYSFKGQDIGPAQFEITFEDGSQAWYGSYNTGFNGKADATTPIEYNIVKWKDPQGNYITYNYASRSTSSGFRFSDSVVRISSIEWGGNDILNRAHFNAIEFAYIDRDLTELSYVQGIEYIQDKILSEVKITSNSNIFKTYHIEYTKDDNVTNYQFLSNITESNSAGEKANPINFEYEKSTREANWSQSTNSSVDTGLLGDFDGDGKIDSLIYEDQPFTICENVIINNSFEQCIKTIDKPAGFYLTKKALDNQPEKFIHAGTLNISKEEFQRAIPISFKNPSKIIENKQGFILYKIEPNTKDLQLLIYSINETNQIEHQYTKVLSNQIYDRTSPEWDPMEEGTTFRTTPLNLMEMDIDGDGISELLMSFNDAEHTKVKVPDNPDFPIGMPDFKDSYRDRTRYIIFNLDNNISTDESYTQMFFYPSNAEIAEIYKIGDFDGDGKTDFLRFDSENRAVLVKLKKGSDNHYSVDEKSFYTNNEKIKGITKGAVIGDFNGDGKSDMLIPSSDTTIDWYLYQSTGKAFIEEFKPNFALYRKTPYFNSNKDGTANSERTSHQAYDLDRDGKSDFVSFTYQKARVKTANFFNINYNNIADIKISNGRKDFHNNITYTFNETLPDQIWNGESTFNRRTRCDYQELLGNFKINQSIHQIILVSSALGKQIFRGTLKKINFYDISKKTRINAITQGGIKTTINYKELDANAISNFYKGTRKEKYPYVEFDRIPQGYAVYQLQQEGKKQDFRYRGMVTHLQGRGMIGFRQTSNSSWYTDGFENTKIWHGIEIDPLNEGVPVKEWSIRTNDESKIFPDDISENNNQLLSFKSILYRNDQLINGQIVNSVTDVDKSKIVKVILPINTRSKNFLTGTITESTVTYSNYYLPAQNVSNVNNGYATTTSTFEYIHNPSGAGTEYYIGRPKSKTDVVQAYGDTKSAKEEYLYENNLLKNIKTWNRDNTGYLFDTYEYDSFGNVIQKTTSNSIDSKTQTNRTEYDAKGRFVIKKVDNLGLETNIEYNDWGQIKKQADPLGNILENTYDSWGKLLTSKTNLSGTTTYEYSRDSNSNISFTQYDPDGNISKKYTNKLGQEYKNATKAFNQNKYIAIYSVYDKLGRKIRDSEPYFEVSDAVAPNDIQWNLSIYDDNVYPAKVTSKRLAKIKSDGSILSFTGKEIESSVSGNTTSVKENNGYERLSTKTTDALGNVIISTDKGGSIQFSYNAAREQIKAQYAENIVTTEYDAWGRKSKFNDPSNGLYQYEYNGFGQPTKTISPKGIKEYSYNNLGQLISQKEFSATDGGSTTNKIISFAYDNKGRVISKTGTSKGKEYNSNVSYDPQGRLLSSSESSNGKYFIQKAITYDDKARVISYEKQLYSSGTLTKIQVENVYSSWNGELYQVKDKSSGKILWELNETNAKGQVLAAKLGAAQITNTYDGNGFLSNVNHSSQVKSGILQLSYSFDAIRNELKSRSTGGDFNINESFDYDDNNRLVNWTDPVTGIKPQPNRNVYDAKGRIIENDQIGTIKFQNSAKIYQPTGMTLNASGTQNYSNDLIQNISYNENNDPVFIDGEKGDVAFQYGLTAMRQQVTYGGNFGGDQEGQFTKFYSEDGSFEVIKNNATGQEKHILYIGGTPYESNIVYLKDFTQSSGSYRFLHKDYIGSVLSISDEVGNKLEQRHFDAWGNFTHLQIGNGTIITDQAAILNAAKNLMIDRGYTSHEHFMEVGIIHMNGRLYDPLLRRFLNADENIQDLSNTQSYNKYGYVFNNPLMFNDPSGEIGFVAGFFLSYIVPIIWGAIVGTAIGVGTYLISSLINNSLSWSGLGRSLWMGAVTGAVAGGLGQIFSASGFWSTVANGALVGAGTGGVTALITGQNFLEGVLKGAVLGGGIAGISYTVAHFTSPSTTSYMEASNENILSDGTPVGNRSYARELYKSEFEQQSGLSSNDIYNRASPGATINPKTGLIELYKKGEKIEALGVTNTGRDFISGKIKSKIYLSNKAFSSREQLSYTLQHELNHVRLDWSSLSMVSGESITFEKSEPGFKHKNLLNNKGHYYIEESGTNFLYNNGWQNMVDHVPEKVFNHIWYRDFNESIKKLLIGTDKKININFK